jgi:Flp pilus assembly protein TadB
MPVPSSSTSPSTAGSPPERAATGPAGTRDGRPGGRLAAYAVAVCVLAVVAAVVSFVRGSFLGVVWILIAGLASNMAWYYVRKAKAARQPAQPG